MRAGEVEGKALLSLPAESWLADPFNAARQVSAPSSSDHSV